MEYIEQLEIGATFKVGSVEYKVVEQKRLLDCEGCSFSRDTCTTIERPFCGAFRKDRKEVIFVKVK